MVLHVNEKMYMYRRSLFRAYFYYFKRKERYDMNNKQSEAGEQTIGCGVTSCRYNGNGSCCQLRRIEVRPCCGDKSSSGQPEDVSCCGSYVQR